MLRSALLTLAAATTLLCGASEAFSQAIPCPVRSLPGAHNISAAIAETETYLNCLQQVTKVPGLAVAIVYKDQIMLLKGYGVR